MASYSLVTASIGHGHRAKAPSLLVLGAALSLGPAWYLLLFWPTMGFLGYSLPFLNLSGALALYYRQRWLAGLLLLPHLGIAGFWASIVLSQ